MKLETERLILRPVKENDATALTKSLNNLNISKWIVPMPYPYQKKDALWWIKSQKKKLKERPRTDYHFIIELKSDKKLLGAVGIFGFDKNKIKGELGYWLDQKYWKKGFMSEAVSRVMDFGFKDLKLKKIVIPVFTKNPSSNALAKKMGCKLEGVLRKHAHCKATGKIHDENMWGILKKEWPAAKRRLKKK